MMLFLGYVIDDMGVTKYMGPLYVPRRVVDWKRDLRIKIVDNGVLGSSVILWNEGSDCEMRVVGGIKGLGNISRAMRLYGLCLPDQDLKAYRRIVRDDTMWPYAGPNNNDT
jgi:hypothetical protein